MKFICPECNRTYRYPNPNEIELCVICTVPLVPLPPKLPLPGATSLFKEKKIIRDDDDLLLWGE